jgi:L1 cell adhesion molecule
MCAVLHRMYRAAPNVCMLCHEECNSTCHGPGPGNCTDCKHVKDGPFCTPVCPTSKYDASGECRPCHENCVDGCKGPENTIGPNGCNSCEKAIINGDVNVVSSWENVRVNIVLTYVILPTFSPNILTFGRKNHARNFFT